MLRHASLARSRPDGTPTTKIRSTLSTVTSIDKPINGGEQIEHARNVVSAKDCSGEVLVACDDHRPVESSDGRDDLDGVNVWDMDLDGPTR